MFSTVGRVGDQDSDCSAECGAVVAVCGKTCHFCSPSPFRFPAKTFDDGPTVYNTLCVSITDGRTRSRASEAS